MGALGAVALVYRITAVAGRRLDPRVLLLAGVADLPALAEIAGVDATRLREGLVSEAVGLRTQLEADRARVALVTATGDAARARATVGEISSALEGVYGRYQAAVHAASEPFGASPDELARVVHPDDLANLLAAWNVAHAAGIAIVLADVDSIRSEFCGEFRMVVENEWNTRFTANRDEDFTDAADGGEIVVLRAELEEVGAAV